jgi:hypothetical protein
MAAEAGISSPSRRTPTIGDAGNLPTIDARHYWRSLTFHIRERLRVSVASLVSGQNNPLQTTIPCENVIVTQTQFDAAGRWSVSTLISTLIGIRRSAVASTIQKRAPQPATTRG